MFRELFEFNENDRNRKEMKRDYREMEQIHKGGVKFKHLIGKVDMVLIILRLLLDIK